MSISSIRIPSKAASLVDKPVNLRRMGSHDGQTDGQIKKTLPFSIKFLRRLSRARTLS